MNVLEVAVTEAFGERCPDYEPECPCCMAWKALDNSERQSKLIDELVEVLKEYAEDEANSRDERLNLLISKAQPHKPNEGQRDE